MTDDLKNIESQDIDDVLKKIEQSFDIKFGVDELASTTTFGQLCDHIENKIRLQSKDDSTIQQAFYKLRTSLSLTLQIDIGKITPKTLLAEIVPRNKRISKIKEIEKHLGFKLSVLRPPYWYSGVLTVVTLLSIIELFFDWKTGLAGFFFGVVGFWFSVFIGKEFTLQTVGQVSEKMVLENYTKSRRDPKTFNKSEISKIVTELFSVELGIDKAALTMDAKFV